jgi:hypothetical protein
MMPRPEALRPKVLRQKYYAPKSVFPRGRLLVQFGAYRDVKRGLNNSCGQPACLALSATLWPRYLTPFVMSGRVIERIVLIHPPALKRVSLK